MVLKGFLTFPAFDEIDDWYTFIFVVDGVEGELIDPEEGYLEWIDDEALLDLPLWAGDRVFLPWLDRPGFFSGKFVYAAGELVSHSVVFYEV
jgi:8-oxo-dGTP diphosphatase